MSKINNKIFPVMAIVFGTLMIMISGIGIQHESVYAQEYDNDPRWVQSGPGFNYTHYITNTTLTMNNTTNTTYTPQWINYTSPNIGVSLMHPSSGWNSLEKVNRFTEGNDLKLFAYLSNDNSQFTILKHNVMLSHNVKQMGLENVTFSGMQSVARGDDVTLIEGVDTKKYRIGGFDTATYLMTGVYSSSGEPYVVRTFIVDQNGHAWRIYYQDSFENFDSPKSQEIMETMISSLKFIT